jgi:hypothetical protein
MTHHCSDITPVRIYQVWPYMRDHARGTTPLAQERLDEARHYCEPSKAHKRRLLKLRPRTIVAPKREAPTREIPNFYELNRQSKLAQAGARFLERNYIRETRTLVPEPQARLQHREYVVKSERDEWDLDNINADIARLRADHERAVREAKA